MAYVSLRILVNRKVCRNLCECRQCQQNGLISFILFESKTTPNYSMDLSNKHRYRHVNINVDSMNEEVEVNLPYVCKQSENIDIHFISFSCTIPLKTIGIRVSSYSHELRLLVPLASRDLLTNTMDKFHAKTLQ